MKCKIFSGTALQVENLINEFLKSNNQITKLEQSSCSFGSDVTVIAVVLIYN